MTDLSRARPRLLTDRHRSDCRDELWGIGTVAVGGKIVRTVQSIAAADRLSSFAWRRPADVILWFATIRLAGPPRRSHPATTGGSARLHVRDRLQTSVRPDSSTRMDAYQPTAGVAGHSSVAAF